MQRQKNFTDAKKNKNFIILDFYNVMY